MFFFLTLAFEFPKVCLFSHHWRSNFFDGYFTIQWFIHKERNLYGPTFIYWWHQMGLILSSPKKKTQHPINKCISFEILMKISTMMVHQYLVWSSSSAITAAIYLGMDLWRELRFSSVMALQTLPELSWFFPLMWLALFVLPTLHNWIIIAFCPNLSGILQN